MLLHVFGHVHAGDRGFVVKQELRQGLGQLGLAHARRAEEQEGADGTAGIFKARTRTAHGVRDRFKRLFLADDPLAQTLFHGQKLLALAFKHLVDRHAGPAADHSRDLLFVHDLFDEGGRVIRGAVSGVFSLFQLLFDLRDLAVFQLGRLAEIAAAFRIGEFGAQAIQPLLEFGRGGELVLLSAPGRGELGGAAFELGQFLVQAFQTLLGRLVSLFLERFSLNLQLDDPAVELIKLFGLGIHLHAQAGRRLVHQVDRLVGQEAVGDVTVRQGRRRHDGAVRDAHPVVHFVFLLQTAKDGDGVFHRRFFHEDRLETPRQSGVLLHMLAILIERRRAHTVQLTARQSRLEEVGRIHCAIGLARADQRVHLVDEEDDVAASRFDFVQHRFQALLELAAILRASNERAHI